MINCLVVGFGGFLGAVSRYLLGLLPLKASGGFPVKTFLINIAGAFVIGLIVSFAGKKGMDPRLLLFLKVGICGGFTTFSSFALETTDLLHAGAYLPAVLYVVFSIFCGIAAVFAAELLMR